MPIDASITGTPLGAITGSVTNADDGTINGTIGYVAIGTLSSSVGVPGPAGVGVPVGGTAGQVLAKVDGVDYNTEWVNVDPSTSWGEITGTLSDQTDLQSALNLKAPLASPVFTGDARAVTAALGDNDTSIATTAFVQQELLSGTANAKNLEVYVRNQTGSTLAAGTIVYVNGATGNRPTVTPAQANNDANSAQTMGFVKTSIANNGFGYVIVRGELENIDTSALTEGVQLYLSPTTAGAWTTTKPSAPQHMVYVGVVIRSHPTQGVILVAVMNGLELEELHNVQIVTPTNGQVLKYDAATNLWKNQTDLNSGVWGSITGTLSSQTDLQSALDAKANLASPVFTGDPRSVTPSLSDNDTSIATTAFVKGQGYATTSALSAYAPLAGATFTGDVTCQTKLVTPQDSNAPVSVTQGQIWHDGTANFYVGTYTDTQDRIILLGELNSTLSSYAPKASPVFTGNPTAPTPATSDNDTSIATTAFVKAQGYITSSALTGYATESWVTTALGSYLTTATAASTYQTQAGMSSYLTTSAAASTYLTQSNAATTYYPLSSNPAGYLTSSALTGYATESFVTSQGYITSAALTPYAPLAGATFTGKINTPAVSTASAFLNLPHGTAPTSPVNGDIWSTTGGLFARINGFTRQYVDLDTTQTINGSKTFSHSSQTLGNSTATGTINVGSGATLSGSTKTVNIGTGGVSGSTTNINIGPTAGTGTATFNALLSTRASATTGAGLRILPGVAPTSPVNGDLWATSTDLQVRLNGVTETVAEQSWVTSQGYITSSALTGYATESWVTSQGYLTSAPVTSVAGRTGAVVLSNTDISGLGTMATATASDYSTTTVANGLYYPLSSNPAGYLTSAPVTSVAGKTGAVTLDVADVSGAAPLASPTFTGTPSLPTGTTAVTQAAGNNTTAVATTAFVQQEVPDFATLAQARTNTNTTTTLSPNLSIWQRMSAAFLEILRGTHTYTAVGTMGTAQNATLGSRFVLGTAGACSGRLRVFGASQNDQSFSMMSKATVYGINFSKPVYCSGRAWPDSTITDPNVTVGWYFGKSEANGAGDLSRRGFGWEIIGNASTRYLTLVVHDGTTLTKVTSSYVVVTSTQTIFDWDVVSDGAGNVTLYVDGAQVATTALGPTGDTNYSGTRPVIWQEEIRTTAATSAFSFVFGRGRIYMGL